MTATASPGDPLSLQAAYFAVTERTGDEAMVSTSGPGGYSWAWTGSVTFDNNGLYSATSTVPDDAPPGNYVIIVTDPTTGLTAAQTITILYGFAASWRARACPMDGPLVLHRG